MKMSGLMKFTRNLCKSAKLKNVAPKENIPMHLETTYPLYAEQILNKIAKTFDGTYAVLKSKLQRFRIYFFRKPAMKGMESTS